MNFVGDYKLSKVIRMSDEGVTFIAVDEAIALEDDPHSKQELQRSKNAILTVCEDGKALYHMPIPEGVPAEEIAKAEASGRIYNGDFLFEEQQIKIENDALYLYDRSQFLTGEEWVKVSTDVEGELNMVTMIYNKIQ